MSIIVSTLGFPRIGPRRELKTSLERYWSGKSDAATLCQDTISLRAANWERQHLLGISHIPSNDFSLYDHVLDTSVMVGAIPEIYGWRGGDVPIDTYFAMARGTSTVAGHGDHVGRGGGPRASRARNDQMVRHQLPLHGSRTVGWPGVHSCFNQPLDEFVEAKRLGFQTRPVLLGPVTYLLRARAKI